MTPIDRMDNPDRMDRLDIPFAGHDPEPGRPRRLPRRSGRRLDAADLAARWLRAAPLLGGRHAPPIERGEALRRVVAGYLAEWREGRPAAEMVADDGDDDDD